MAPAIAICALGLIAPKKTGVVMGDARLELTIDAPEPNSVVGDPGGMAFVAGKALAHFGEYQTFDIMFVIDRSDSTSAPAGMDVDGDGTVGRKPFGRAFSIFGDAIGYKNTDKGDSILAAEVLAVGTLLDQLDPRTTRVGIVTFGGDPDPFTPDAETWVPLTTDYDKVRQGLKQILREGPYGRTNMVAGVMTGTVELLGLQSAYSVAREDSKRIMMFLTDGVPTLPLESSPNQNTRLTLERARKAAELGVRIDTFAISDGALRNPVVAVEMARETDGEFTPVRHPKDLVTLFEDVSFSDIEELRIQNHTTKTDAEYIMNSPDGTFSALLPMREGRNTIEVFARSSDGTQTKRRISLNYLKDAAAQVLDPRLLAMRNRLLENRLLDLRRRSMALQAERDENVRQKLADEIAKERAQAEARADEARRRLELEVEKDESERE